MTAVRPRARHTSSQCGRRGAARAGAGGYATAELAVALPVLALALAACVWGLRVVTADIRCVDAAREAARAAARGDGAARAVSEALPLAPPGARVLVTFDRRTAKAWVGATVPGLAGVLPAMPVRAVASSLLEAGSQP